MYFSIPLLTGMQSSVPAAALAVGLLTASLLALAVYLTGRARRRSKKAEAANRDLQQQVLDLKRAGETLCQLSSLRMTPSSARRWMAQS
jgi:hypothetical protein